LFCSLTVFVLLQSHDLSPDLPPHGLPPSIASLRMESDPIDQRHLRLFWINVSAVSLSHQTWTRPDFFFFLSFHSFSLLPQSLIHLSLTVQANLLRLSRILYSGLGTSLSTSPSLGDGGTRGLGRGSSHRRRLEAEASSQVGKSEGIRADHRRRRNQTPATHRSFRRRDSQSFLATTPSTSDQHLPSPRQKNSTRSFPCFHPVHLGVDQHRRYRRGDEAWRKGRRIEEPRRRQTLSSPSSSSSSSTYHQHQHYQRDRHPTTLFSPPSSYHHLSRRKTATSPHSSIRPRNRLLPSSLLRHPRLPLNISPTLRPLPRTWKWIRTDEDADHPLSDQSRSEPKRQPLRLGRTGGGKSQDSFSTSYLRTGSGHRRPKDYSSSQAGRSGYFDGWTDLDGPVDCVVFGCSWAAQVIASLHIVLSSCCISFRSR